MRCRTVAISVSLKKVDSDLREGWLSEQNLKGLVRRCKLSATIPLQVFHDRRCQSVTQEPAREGIVAGASVGHGLWERGCNTVNPATRVVSGVLVGHFGENGTKRKV